MFTEWLPLTLILPFTFSLILLLFVYRFRRLTPFCNPLGEADLFAHIDRVLTSYRYPTIYVFPYTALISLPIPTVDTSMESSH